MSKHLYSSYEIIVFADSDSTFLVRVCGLLASLSLNPQWFQARRDGATGGIRLAISLIDASARQVDLLERKLLQLTQVHGVTNEQACDREALKSPSAGC